MAKLRDVLLGTTLMLVAGLGAAATAVRPSLADNAIEFPTCEETAEWREQDATAMHEIAAVEDDSVANAVEAGGSLVEEYLSFHAQATEETGKLSPMPWSRLRTHAN